MPQSKLVQRMRKRSAALNAAAAWAVDGDAVLLEKGADEIVRLQAALVRYGDRARMSNAPPELQQTIDQSFEDVQRQGRAVEPF